MAKKNIITDFCAVAFLIALGFYCKYALEAELLLPFFTVVVFTVVSSISDRKISVASAVAVTALSVLINKNSATVSNEIIAVVTGFVCGESVKRKKSFAVTASVGIGIMYTAYLFLTAKQNNISSLNGMFVSLENMMINASKGIPNADEANIKALVNLVRNLYPSIIITFSAVCGYLTLFFTVILLKFLKEDTSFLGFSRIKTDRIAPKIFVISLIVTFFAKDGIVGIVSENIYVILSFILEICGMSLFDYYLKVVRKRRFVFRFFVILLVSCFPFSSFVYIIMAMLDSSKNYRNIAE